MQNTENASRLSLIRRASARLASPQNPGQSREAYGIKSLLNVLYAEHRDVMETANFLKDNYSGEENQ